MPAWRPGQYQATISNEILRLGSRIWDTDTSEGGGVLFRPSEIQLIGGVS